MLPPGVVEGGTAMKLRVGETASRFTGRCRISGVVASAIGQVCARLSFGPWAKTAGAIARLRKSLSDRAEPTGQTDDEQNGPSDHGYDVWEHDVGVEHRAEAHAASGAQCVVLRPPLWNM
jgi:hypothetical protein